MGSRWGFGAAEKAGAAASIWAQAEPVTVYPLG